MRRHERVTGAPRRLERVGVRALQVLLQDGEPAAGVEVDHGVRGGAEVDDLADHAGGDAAVTVDAAVVASGLQGDLLGPDAHRAGHADQRLRHLALQQVGGAHEAGDEGGGGLLVELDRGGDLLDEAVAEDRDPVAHRERLLLVVGDEHERDAEVALHLLELDLHLAAQLEVERAERLVEQQHPRPVHQRPGERDPLALAAGELVRAAVPEARQPHRLERLQGAGAGLGPRHLLDPQAVGHVLQHAHVREQCVVLEDRVDVAGERRQVRDVVAAQQDLSVGRALEARDHPEHGRLAGAGRAQHREELAVEDLEIDAGHGGDRPERLVQPTEGDSHRHARSMTEPGYGFHGPDAPRPTDFSA